MARQLGRLRLSKRHMLHHMSRCWFRKAALLASVFATAPVALAQVRAESIPDSALRPTNLMAVAPAAEAPAGITLPRTALVTPRSEPFAPETAMPISYSTTFLGSTVQLDMPRYDSSGKYVRPKFYVGMQSDAMRNWMNSTGLAADKCMLPMLRARTHMNGDGEVSGSLWVYARCTFR
jgi:hypothetical protein